MVNAVCRDHVITNPPTSKNDHYTIPHHPVLHSLYDSTSTNAVLRIRGTQYGCTHYMNMVWHFTQLYIMNFIKMMNNTLCKVYAICTSLHTTGDLPLVPRC